MFTATIPPFVFKQKQPSISRQKKRTDKVVVEPEPSSTVTDNNATEYYVIVGNETGKKLRDSVEIEEVSNIGDIIGQEGAVICEQKFDGNIEVLKLLDDPLTLGATESTTDNIREEDSTSVDAIRLIEPIPQGMKMRRSRVFGTYQCPECGQTFVNTPRLERHLAVHQVFGSYLCPLCGKTYKYEYNLFYHWRKTCRDLNELMEVEDRKIMDVTALRQLVDEVAAKKAELGTLDTPFKRALNDEPQVNIVHSELKIDLTMDDETLTQFVEEIFRRKREQVAEETEVTEKKEQDTKGIKEQSLALDVEMTSNRTVVVGEDAARDYS